jgi:hypothetical protein
MMMPILVMMRSPVAMRAEHGHAGDVVVGRCAGIHIDAAVASIVRSRAAVVAG